MIITPILFKILVNSNVLRLVGSVVIAGNGHAGISRLPNMPQLAADHLQGAAHYAHTTLSIVCVTYHFIVPPCFLAPLFKVATVSGTPAAQGPCQRTETTVETPSC